MSPEELLTPVLRRSVKSVVAESTPQCEALCLIAMGSQTEWTYPQWLAVERTLTRCKDKVEDWLAVRI